MVINSWLSGQLDMSLFFVAYILELIDSNFNFKNFECYGTIP